MHTPARHRNAAQGNRGFTLLESMLSAGLLFVIVVAVLSAITAGQQHAYDAQIRIAGSLAADELMGRISSASYNTIGTWNNHVEQIGNMTDKNGAAMPAMFKPIGRTVKVTNKLETLPNGVKVRGMLVEVSAVDSTGSSVCTLRQFIPEPM